MSPPGFSLVSRAAIERRIAKTDFALIAERTICIITLDNGHQVRGEAMAQPGSPACREVGEQLAHGKAFAKLYPLFAFLQTEQRFAAERQAAASAPSPSAAG